jgi:hypothetical protein
MTDLIERVDVASAEDETLVATEAIVPRDDRSVMERTDRKSAVNRPVHVLFAVAAGGSAVLLFAIASAYLHGARATLGVVAALAQVVVAIGVFTRPSRALLWAGIATNVALAVLWPTVFRYQSVSWATVGIGMALSGIVVVTGVVLAVRPTVGKTWTSGMSVIGSIVPVAVAAIAIAGLFATSMAKAPASSSSAATTPTALAESTTVQVPGENSNTFKGLAAGNKTEKSELQKWVPLNPHDQAILSGQLAQSYQAAMRYPTVASAKAAHMVLAGGMAPGVGAHYQELSETSLKGVNPDGSINAPEPASWIYASTATNAPVVGVMYESLSTKKPSGFVGPNDHWHRHSNLCVQFTPGKIAVPFAPDQVVTPQECADVHGTFMKKTVWMVHAWVVPGWESPQGVFSHSNLHIYCPGNTDLTNAIGFCLRQS